MNNTHSHSRGGYVDPNWPSPLGPDDAPIIIYGYKPSFVLALLGIILFSISFVAHTYQVIRYRTWYFLPFAVGTLLEIPGYISRTLSAKVDPYRINFFVIQYFFIVVAPVLFSAAIYTILSILVKRVPNGRAYSLLSPRALIYLFVACDIVATIIQTVGAALVGVRESTDRNPTPPNNAVLGGLAFQVSTFFTFIVLTGHFLFRARHVLFKPSSANLPGESSPDNAEPKLEADGVTPEYRGISKSFLIAFTIATFAVYLRTCFRTADTAKAGYGTRTKGVHESEFGALEFAPIVVCVFLFNFWHPGRCLRA